MPRRQPAPGFVGPSAPHREWSCDPMKVSPENFVKVTLMAVVGLAVLRMAAARLGIAGLTELVG